MAKRLWWLAAGILFAAVRARANNLAAGWMDEVTHEVKEQSPDKPKTPLDFEIRAGLYGYYTDNLFLSTDDAQGEFALIPFAGAHLDYADARLEIVADALVNYDFYLETPDAREDEERLYGRIRYFDGTLDLQLVQMVRREIEPADAVFLDRNRRIVSDTNPRVLTRVGPGVDLEFFGGVQIVRFEGDGDDNETYQLGAGVLGEVADRLFLVGQAGFQMIRYSGGNSPPDARGVFARAGARGELLPTLSGEVLVGISHLSADDEEAGDSTEESRTSPDVGVRVRWEALPTVTVLADFSHRFGFGGGRSSFQTVDRALLIVEWEAMSTVTVKARAQYDYVDPTEDEPRSYGSLGVGATWLIWEHFALDGGVVRRQGQLPDGGYGNWVVYVGTVFLF